MMGDKVWLTVSGPVCPKGVGWSSCQCSVQTSEGVPYQTEKTIAGCSERMSMCPEPNVLECCPKTFTVIKNKEKQQIPLFMRLEPANV